MRLLLLLLLTIHHCSSTCGNGWTRFERESGGWCVRIIYWDLVNQTHAEELCKLGYVVNDMTGRLNDVSCRQDSADMIGGDEFAIRGFLCGKKEFPFQ